MQDLHVIKSVKASVLFLSAALVTLVLIGLDC